MPDVYSVWFWPTTFIAYQKFTSLLCNFPLRYCHVMTGDIEDSIMAMISADQQAQLKELADSLSV
jgi:hypothetical protein